MSPTRRSRRLLPAAFALLTLPLLACADAAEAPGEATASPATPQVAGGQIMVDNLLEQAATAREKLEALAGAMTEAQYDWRPGEGVRSVGEVFQHVAADNYLLPALMGVEAPAATGITTDYATVQAYEGRDMSRDEIMAALSASFDHLEASAAPTRGDLQQTFTAFGSEYTVGGMWTMMVTHMHEHLGQSIAYARSNGVVPPWSN